MENSDNYTLRNRRKRASDSNNKEENVGNKRHAHTSVSSNYESKMNKSNEILEIQCVAAMMHQGSEDFSELSRGRQCVANALASIAFKSLPGKEVEKWDSDDLHFLLYKGDELYRHTRRKCLFPYLHPSDLPKGICFSDKLLKLTIQTTFSGDMSSSFQDNTPFYSLPAALNCCLADGSCSGILVCKESAVAIFYSNSDFHVFDPHARDKFGNPCSNGSAVLLTVQSFLQLQILLRRIFHVDGSSTFDLHQIKTSCMGKNSFLRIKDRLCLSNIDSCTACSNVSKFQDDYTRHPNVIENFHSSVSTGPSFVCKSCTQTWFKHSVKKATGISEDFLMYCSLNSEDILCHTCYRHLKEKKIPPCSSMNGLKFPVKPSELDLTHLEERLCAPRIPFMQLREKPRGGQLSIM